MKKNVVKINENTLRRIVAESVKKVLRESVWDDTNSPESKLSTWWEMEWQKRMQECLPIAKSDFKFLRYLEREGINIENLTDWDIFEHYMWYRNAPGLEYKYKYKGLDSR